MWCWRCDGWWGDEKWENLGAVNGLGKVAGEESMTHSPCSPPGTRTNKNNNNNSGNYIKSNSQCKKRVFLFLHLKTLVPPSIDLPKAGVPQAAIPLWES